MSETQPELKTYHGNCHCGAFKFTIDVPEITAVTRCKCSICFKKGYQWLFPAPGCFKIVKGEGSLKDYTFATGTVAHKVSVRSRDRRRLANTITSSSARHVVQVCKAIEEICLPGGILESITIFDNVAREPHYVAPKFTGTLPTAEVKDPKIYEGGCHCGAVKIALKISGSLTDGDIAIEECNCSICTRLGTILCYPKKDQVSFDGTSNLTTYSFGPKHNIFRFCSTCGISVNIDRNPATVTKEELDSWSKDVQNIWSNLVPVNLKCIAGVEWDDIEIKKSYLRARDPQYVVPESQDLDPSPRYQQLAPLPSQDTRESSMLYSLLPNVVQSRLPRIPSIRSSVGLQGIGKAASTGTTTPEPGYPPASLYGAGQTTASSDGGESGSYFADETLYSEEDIPRTKARRELLELPETKTGIAWKFANQGLSLLSLAVEESSTVTRNPQYGNPSLARQLYIHSLTYLLRALPPDLTAEEVISLQASLPTELIPVSKSTADTDQPRQYSQSNHPPSFLHKTLASIIIQLFILFQFVLPYLKYILASAYQYERSHKLSEKLLTRSITTLDTVGKHSLALTAAVYGIGDGKFGQVLTDIAAWVVDGITGGIHDGLGEGLAIVGGKRGAEVKETK
ncbi:glutathione-dependent formaldehyde-activating enzyme protein [Rutstroemia sp. NJR-2017a BBW]|nr:glutathione-dependent formaldehyde-activating enzyme protein [Rutstroemia sp. NJR-2017a BBW]